MPFPVDLKEETVTPMVVGEPQTYLESSQTYGTKRILGELGLEGIMPTEEGVEVM